MPKTTANPAGRSGCAGIDRSLLEELSVMLGHDVLARDRMRDDQNRARQNRLAKRLATARRWQRLARYADRQARRAIERL